MTDHGVMQPALPQYVVPLGEASQSGQIDRVLGESSRQSGHFADNCVTPLEPLEYSEDTLGNEVMVESEASIVTGSALALSDSSRDDEGGGATFSSSVSIGNLIAESYALCQDGVVSGSEGLDDSVGREGTVTALGGEDEDVVR